ncbi:MAG TPA: hypothetical protein VG099_31575 [Gemmataceae bacterium]|nr:hypothetical protein [Gemmataceae bacterium]
MKPISLASGHDPHVPADRPPGYCRLTFSPISIPVVFLASPGGAAWG